MYGIATRLIIRKSTSCCVNKHYSKIVQCLSEHNLKLANHRFKITKTLSSYTGIYRGFAKHNIVHNTDDDRTFAAVATAYNEQGRIYSAGIVNILENSNLTLLKDNEDLLLLQCCGYATADLSLQGRAELCEKVWAKLKECGVDFNISHYNTYLQICIENRVHLDFEKFLTRMECEPNQETYRLLLDCASEVGDVQQAVTLVSVMKNKNFPADERLFDALVLAHAINGGLKDAEKVLQTMQTARVLPSSTTYFAIIRGLAWRKEPTELLQALDMYPNVVHEGEFLKLLLILGLNGNHSWLNKILQILPPITFSKENIKQLDLLCIHLVHSGQPETAMVFYKKFIDTASVQDEGAYAFSLLVEMLRSSTPTDIVIKTTKNLQESGLNSLAVEKLTGVALRRGHSEIAWKLLEAMPNLRCHYFWPLILQASKTQGEAGVLSTLKKMLEWNVKPDLDTLEYYSIPFCDSTEPKDLLIRLQNLGFTARELLTPMSSFLLKTNRIVSVQQLCKEFEPVLIQPERLLHYLVKACKRSGDVENTLKILKKLCQTPVVPGDYAGQFLSRALNVYQLSGDHELFLDLVQKMQMKRFKISLPTADSVMYRLNLPSYQCEESAKIKEAVNSLVDATVNQRHSYIPHPRDMTVTELENHLMELQSKNMETRGVLRRLIQEHAQLGNDRKVAELQKQFVAAGYNETGGMKAAMLKVYLSNNDINNALNIYTEIKTAYPTFTLDDFKILDLATLLTKENKFELAINILLSETEKRKARGGPGVIRNCWRLLGASTNDAEVEKLFHILIERGYCVPSNNILGPLVKVHLNKNDLRKAVEVYTECAGKYKCTPLQLELLCAVVEGEQEQLLQEVLNVTSKIHGSEIATISLIAALAQSGLHKSLRKYLHELQTIPKKEFEKRCQQWVHENKLSALETLAKAAYRLPSDKMNQSIVYHSIMKIHSINNDCEAAEAFYNQLVEKRIEVPRSLTDELCRLTNRCKNVRIS